MKIYSVTDPEFIPYGRVIEGYDVSAIVETLREKTPLPEGTKYIPEDENIHALPIAKEIETTLFGGVPAEFGWCNGHNTKLNCLEYHRCSEFNLGTEDFILLLGKQDELVDWKLDTSKVKAFKVPAGVLIEVYATTLHFAPCHADPAKGFRTLVVLSKGTNDGFTAPAGKTSEDRLLFATNKWLIAHPEAPQAEQGAFIGLIGENIDIADSL
ncbi:MAG: DUF4867 family protein [Lachnospiraceae bacterium]|nr:DUF4867 family protein [Lachnospiraceae bacterium]